MHVIWSKIGFYYNARSRGPLIPVRSAEFYSRATRGILSWYMYKNIASLTTGTPSGKRLITMEFCMTRPGPTRSPGNIHSTVSILPHFVCDFSRKFEGFNHPHSFNFMGRISIARVFSVCFLLGVLPGWRTPRYLLL